VKEKIEQIDTLLSHISVKGEDVITLAKARMLLAELYKEVIENARN